MNLLLIHPEGNIKKSLDTLSEPEIIQNCFGFFDKHIAIKNIAPSILQKIKETTITSKLNKLELYRYIFADLIFISKAKIKKLIVYKENMYQRP